MKMQHCLFHKNVIFLLDVVLFLLLSCLGAVGRVVGSSFGFSCYSNSYCMLRTNMTVLATAKCVCSNCMLRNQGNDHQFSKRSQWTHCETDLGDNSI